VELEPILADHFVIVLTAKVLNLNFELRAKEEQASDGTCTKKDPDR